MTARQCERCGEALHPCEDVILVLNASLEDFENGRVQEFELVAVFHSACYDEIEIKEVDPDEYGDEAVGMEKLVHCGSCGRPIKRAVITCPACFRRRTWEY